MVRGFVEMQGCGPTVMRAMVVNAAQLATYSQAKQLLLASGYFRDNILCHFTSSMISGLACTVASLPVDIAKTRQVHTGWPENKPQYQLRVNCARWHGRFLPTLYAFAHKCYSK